jgi:hypothetical protein
MKPHIHARNSVRKYGGKPEDYMPIHDAIDSSKSAHASMRHRAVLHSSFGIYLIERIFGATFTNSDGKIVSVRDVAEDHVIEDLGTIPSLEKWLDEMPMQAWMGGPTRKHKFIKID